MSKSKSFAVAAGVAGAIALATTASAAPVTSSTLALKNAAPNDVVQVRSRGWHRAGVAAGIGFAAGTLIGAAATSSAYAYDPYWYGYEPAYSYGYGPGWGYNYAPAYAYDFEPNYTYAAPAPIVRPRARVVVEPGPTVFAGPRPLFHRQLFLDANPALGTIHGASGVD